ncbi:hypothetical protein ARTHRO8AJ_380063 [Arthrobacter sp. 8AJ]|nr:hypothetical protein ARTHRO8AJ_380063 [Arthrobacter sp. 8AJ]
MSGGNGEGKTGDAGKQEPQDIVRAGGHDVCRRSDQRGHQPQPQCQDFPAAAGRPSPRPDAGQLLIPDSLGFDKPLPLGTEVKTDEGTGGSQFFGVVASKCFHSRVWDIRPGTPQPAVNGCCHHVQA